MPIIFISKSTIKVQENIKILHLDLNDPSLYNFSMMNPYLSQIFDDSLIVAKIQRRLPYLFQLAELESKRGKQTGMEVGTLRERIIIALLMYKFGEDNIETEIPITEPEVDVRLFQYPARPNSLE